MKVAKQKVVLEICIFCIVIKFVYAYVTNYKICICTNDVGKRHPSKMYKRRRVSRSSIIQEVIARNFSSLNFAPHHRLLVRLSQLNILFKDVL